MNILITGANGFLATELIKQLRDTNHKVFTLSRNKKEVKSKHGDWLNAYDLEDWRDKKLPLDKIDVVVHSAFARAIKGGNAIAKSLLFTQNLFQSFKESRVNAIVNISTQEVYGKISSPWVENKEVDPNTIYGTAKYYTELLTGQYSEQKDYYSTSIRLAGLLSHDTDARMVNKFVDNVLKNESIKILDGKLLFSQLDVRDAAAGIIALLKIPVNQWNSIYNLGFLKSYSIQEIAETVRDVARKYNKTVEIIKEQSDSVIDAQLDSTLLYNQTLWKPSYDMKSIVESIFEYKLKKNEIE